MLSRGCFKCFSRCAFQKFGSDAQCCFVLVRVQFDIDFVKAFGLMFVSLCDLGYADENFNNSRHQTAKWHESLNISWPHGAKLV